MGDAKGPTSVVSVMPGKVVRILVNEGDEVEAGQGVVVVEAMKMENEVKSGVDGTVKKVNVAAGDSVGTSEVMVEIEPAE
jgi:pyruvate carboxylase subunit B